MTNENKELRMAKLERDSALAELARAQKDFAMKEADLKSGWRGTISERDQLRADLAAAREALEHRGRSMDTIEDAFGERWIVKNREDGSFDWQASAVASITEAKYLAERFKKERDGAMHSGECWELMHAKRHEELEAAKKENAALTARADAAERERDAGAKREAVLRQIINMIDPHPEYDWSEVNGKYREIEAIDAARDRIGG